MMRYEKSNHPIGEGNDDKRDDNDDNENGEDYERNYNYDDHT